MPRSILAEVVKVCRPHKVPMAARALALLDDLRPIAGNDCYLLPSLGFVQRPISENTLSGALRCNGFHGNEMTANKFRATFLTLANESGL
jgi:hypothetical protein